MGKTITVTPEQVYAAGLLVKHARMRGETPDRAIEAVANATVLPDPARAPVSAPTATTGPRANDPRQTFPDALNQSTTDAPWPLTDEGAPERLLDRAVGESLGRIARSQRNGHVSDRPTKLELSERIADVGAELERLRTAVGPFLSSEEVRSVLDGLANDALTQPAARALAAALIPDAETPAPGVRGNSDPDTQP